MKIIFHHIRQLALLAVGLFAFGSADAQIASQTLEGNNIKAHFSADGQLFWDGKNAHFEVPKGSGKNTISAASLWIGGLDTKGDLHLSAQTYRESGSDFWPGPLDENAEITEATSQQYNKIWKISKLQVDSFRLGLGVPQIIMDWPQAAPYIDTDKNGLYEPLKGDYPDIKGDEMLWWVFNDNLKAHTETGGKAFGIEVQASAFTFNCENDDILKNTIFLNYKIINRSKNNYDSVYAGIWADFDIGNLFDDYVGSDSTLNTFYAYNADDFDNDTVINSKSGEFAYKGFGKMLPVQSLTYLQGMKGKDGKELNMSKFIYYNNEVSGMGNPRLPMQYYNLLRGQWQKNQPLAFGGDGYHNGTEATNFAFPGNINNKSEWTEVSAGNKAGDRRGLGTFGPITLNSGETQEFTAAFLYTQASSGKTNRAVETMKNQVSTLAQNFRKGALSPCTSLSYCQNEADCVWPGDANKDGKASASDIFNIGYAFGEKGAARTMVSSAWVPQFAADWQNQFPNGANFKYADANGNGQIDSADVLPLYMNLGGTHGKDEDGEKATNADPVLLFNFEEDSVAPGKIVTATLSLGTNGLTIDDVQGLSGNIVFDPGVIEASTITIDWNGSDFGTTKDIIVLQKYDFNTGTFVFGFSRKGKDGKPVNDKDIIIRWKLVIDPNVGGNKKYHAKMEAVTIVNSNLEKITVNTQGDDILVTDNTVGIAKVFRDLSRDLKLYPNPAQNTITVDFPAISASQIRIVNMQGKEMLHVNQPKGTNHIALDLNHFPQGIYMVEIQNAEGRAIKKFSKLR